MHLLSEAFADVQAVTTVDFTRQPCTLLLCFKYVERPVLLAFDTWAWAI